MKCDVYNINQVIRRVIIEEFSELLSDRKNGYRRYLKYMNYLKEEDIDTYKIIISALYPAFYLENSINLMENEAFREYECEYDDVVLDDDCYFIENDVLDGISSIEELVAFSFEEPNFLPLLLENNEIFYCRTFLEKRSLMLDIGWLDKYFCRICPSFVFEKIDCCMELTCTDIINIYELFCDESFVLHQKGDSKTVEAINMTVNFLRTLSLYDNDNFSSIMSYMSDSTRKYMNYLCENKDLNTFDLHFINMYDNKNKKNDYEKIFFDAIISDRDIANNFFVRFLQYSFIDEDIKSKIDGEEPNQKKKIK